jgi:NAD(P)H-hydrate epimerase
MAFSSDAHFRTEDGTIIPAVSAEQMQEVDRVAVEEYGLGILQMMENAGRNLAGNVMEMLGRAQGSVTVLAGSGGNGGGGLCCARHLRNRGIDVSLLLSKEPEALTGAAAHQFHILKVAGLDPASGSEAQETIGRAELVVDALVGYSLRGSPRGRVAELIDLCNRNARRVLSLDVPSGLDATNGDAPGQVVRADRTLTLALPKTGLREVGGDLYLADIGIPPELYQRIGLRMQPIFAERYWLQLETLR